MEEQTEMSSILLRVEKKIDLQTQCLAIMREKVDSLSMMVEARSTLIKELDRKLKMRSRILGAGLGIAFTLIGMLFFY